LPTSHLPLNALRAFEAAARLGSMSAAATELGVTHGAVSRQIKALEDRFGLPLFERHPRAIVATREGAQLASDVAEAFERLQIAVSRVQPGPLTLSCSATIMMRWLIPRLPKFKFANPSSDIRLNISFDDTDFVHEEISLAIRTTMFKPPQAAIAETVISEEIGPVCNPDYAARLGCLRPDDLMQARILVNATRPNAWSEWAIAAGRPDLKLAAHEVYGHFYLVIQAAAVGLGFALAPFILVEDEIRSGHLVAPFGFVVGPHNLQLWMASHQRNRPDLKAAASWLRDELRSVHANK
jgi:DNA-binding transcriptional LysR family regulator